MHRLWWIIFQNIPKCLFWGPKNLTTGKNFLAQTSSKTNNTCCAKMRSLNWISEIWSNWIQWAGLHFSSVLLHCTVMEIGNALLWFVMQHRMQAVVKYFAKYIRFFLAFLHFNRLDRIVLPDRAVSSGRISIVPAITRSGMPPLCIIHPLTPTFSLQYNAIYNQCIMYYTSAQSNFFILIQSMHCGLYIRWLNLFGAIIMHQTSDDIKLFIQCILHQLNSSHTPGNPSRVISESFGEENVIFSGDRGEKVPWNRHRLDEDGKSMDWRFLGFTITKTKQVDILLLLLLQPLFPLLDVQASDTSLLD